MMQNYSARLALLFLALTSTLFAGLTPLPRVVKEEEARRKKFIKIVDEDRVGTFFEEGYAAGGYPYKYPEATSKVYMGEEMGKDGEVSLVFDLDAHDYSGGAVVLHSTSFDLKSQFGTGALEFWIRGEEGGEKAFIALADDETDDGIKSEIKVHLDNYGGIQPFWTHISIPLADFGYRGAYWDEKKQREIKHPFDWSTVKEFLVVIEKGDQSSFKVFVDNIYVVKDKYDEPADLYAPYWDEVAVVVPNRPDKPESTVVLIDTLYEGNFVEPMFGHVYGGETAFREQTTDAPEINPHVMGMYLDNSDYSGINLNFGRTVDVSKLRDSGGGIGFWAYFTPGVTQVFVGIHDGDADGRSVGTSVLLEDFGTIDTGWHYMMIPLKEFSNEGGWWDESIKAEQPGEMDWSSIFEISVTGDKYGNRIAPGIPVEFYVDQIALIESVPGYKDPEAFWDTFTSNAPDRLLFDFENHEEGWEAIAGELSMISYAIANQPDRELRGTYGRYYLEMNWSVNDWAFIGYPFARFNSGPTMRDWSKHSAMKFDVYSNRDASGLEVKVKDAGKEEWTATVSLKRGWNSVTLPFRKLRKYPYYQVPGAIVDGVLDLTNVTELSFEPKDIGVVSSTIIDNITLTQEQKK